MADREKEIIKLIQESKSELSENLIKSLLKRVEESDEIIDINEYIDNLYRLKEVYETSNEFKAGDIIVWKEGMKNKKLPKYKQPCIVLSVLDNPIIDTNKDPGSTYFGEILDIKVGMIGPESEFLTFHYDSRRFTHLKKK